MDLFTEMPSKVGFVVAISQYVLGRVGNDRSVEEQQQRMQKINSKFNNIFEQIGSFNTEQLRDFLSFDVLNEKVKILYKRKIGDAQREYFKKVFSEMIDMNDEINSLEVVWASY